MAVGPGGVAVLQSVAAAVPTAASVAARQADEDFGTLVAGLAVQQFLALGRQRLLQLDRIDPFGQVGTLFGIWKHSHE